MTKLGPTGKFPRGKHDEGRPTCFSGEDAAWP
jgi:hypothetical protein